MTRILVIKLGALGDFVQALGPMEAIRHHHPAAQITLLTTRPFADLATATRFFDDIWLDERPALLNFPALLRLRRRLRAAQFDRVYDLQTSDRSGWYFRLFWPSPPEWSGIAPGCSHPHSNPARDHMHTLDRQRDQLRDAGIVEVPAPNLTWAQADLTRFGLKSPYIVLVPGGSAHRLAKRWPATHFAALARILVSRGFQPVILGGPAERDLAEAILADAPDAVNLAGQTDLVEIATIGRKAAFVVGNDTGPTHLLAVAGSPTIVLYSSASDPALTAPRGTDVQVLQRDSLADLQVDEVADRLHLG